MRNGVFLGAVASFLMLTACSSHYQVTNVSRTRILIDNTYDATPDAAAAAFLAPYKQKVDTVMGPVVGQAACDMVAERPESKLSNLLPDIFMYMAKYYQEKPDVGDVLDIAPFENKICFLTMTGKQVTRLFEQIAARGGEGVSHGVQLVISKDGALVSARLNGKEIDPNASYRITTIDYLAQGNDGLSVFKEATALNSPSDAKNNARYIIADYFREMMKAGKIVGAEVEGRIVVK